MVVLQGRDQATSAFEWQSQKAHQADYQALNKDFNGPSVRYS